MSFITGKHLPRRTFLRGMGATVALPFLDAMVPAGGLSRTLRAATAAASRRGSSASRRCTALPDARHSVRANSCAPEKVGRDFTLVPDNPLSTLEAYRGTRSSATPTCAWPKRSTRRKSAATTSVERGVPHAGASETDAGLGHLGGHVAGPDARSARPEHAAPRCSSASRTSTRPVAAPTTTPAPTRTRSAGRRRTSRCR